MGIGNTIRELRGKAGLSQGQLARKTRLTPSAVSQIELGKIEPRRAVLDVLAEVLLPGHNHITISILACPDEKLPEELLTFKKKLK